MAIPTTVGVSITHAPAPFKVTWSGGAGNFFVDIPVPAGIVLDYYLMPYIYTHGGPVTGVTPNARWTSIFTVGTGTDKAFSRFQIWWDNAGASESGVFSFTVAASASPVIAYGGVIVLRAVNWNVGSGIIAYEVDGVFKNNEIFPQQCPVLPSSTGMDRAFLLRLAAGTNGPVVAWDGGMTPRRNYNDPATGRWVFIADETLQLPGVGSVRGLQPAQKPARSFYATIGLRPNFGPNAPRIITPWPADAIQHDGTVTWSWVYSHPDPNSAQNGVYLYNQTANTWWTGSTWSGTKTKWNLGLGTSGSVTHVQTFGTLNTYGLWCVDDSSREGVAIWFGLYGLDTPAPSMSTTFHMGSPFPLFRWLTGTGGTGTVLKKYHLKIVPDWVYNLAGFDPGTVDPSTIAYDSGIHDIPADLNPYYSLNDYELEVPDDIRQFLTDRPPWAIAMVVGDSGALSTAETAMKARLETLAELVTVFDDSAAESAISDRLYRVIFITDSATAATVGTKWKDFAGAVVVGEELLWAEFELSSDDGSESSLATFVVPSTKPGWLSLAAGTYDWLDGGGSVSVASNGTTDVETPAVVTRIATNSGATSLHVWTIEAGALRDDSTTAPGRRAATVLQEGVWTGTPSTEYLQMFDDLIRWLMLTPVAPFPTTIDFRFYFREYYARPGEPGLWSAWTFQQNNDYLVFLPPAPVVTVTAQADHNEIDIQGIANLLSAHGSGLVSTTYFGGGASVLERAYITGDVSQPVTSPHNNMLQPTYGTRPYVLSLRMDVDNGDFSFGGRTPDDTLSTGDLASGDKLTVRYSAKCAVGENSFLLDAELEYFDDVEGGVSLGSDAMPQLDLDVTNWQSVNETVTPPNGTKAVKLNFSTTVTLGEPPDGDVAFAEVLITHGDGTAWSRGVDSGSHTVTLEALQGDGVTWAPVLDDNTGELVQNVPYGDLQRLTVLDYGTPSGVAREYRAIAGATIEFG